MTTYDHDHDLTIAYMAGYHKRDDEVAKLKKTAANAMSDYETMNMKAYHLDQRVKELEKKLSLYETDDNGETLLTEKGIEACDEKVHRRLQQRVRDLKTSVEYFVHLCGLIFIRWNEDGSYEVKRPATNGKDEK